MDSTTVALITQAATQLGITGAKMSIDERRRNIKYAIKELNRLLAPEPDKYEELLMQSVSIVRENRELLVKLKAMTKNAEDALSLAKTQFYMWNLSADGESEQPKRHAKGTYFRELEDRIFGESPSS
jgi:3-methyladenine DNA glycosylase Tag